jgi:hypothetical protein
VTGGTATIQATSGAINGSTTVVVRAAPSVSSTSPIDGATSVRAGSSLAITFSTAMDPATLTAQTAAGACSGTIQVSNDNFTSCVGFTTAAPVMSGGNTVATLVPLSLIPLETYRLRVAATVTSAAMVPMGTTFTHTIGFRMATDGSCGAHLVISQVYGGGGNTGAQYTHDFIELHNPTAQPISLAGYAIQFSSSAASATYAAQALPSVSIPAGGYYLIQESTNAAMGAPLPTPDFIPSTSPFQMGATSGKIALTNTTTVLGINCPPAGTIVDLVQYGATVGCAEGGTATAATSNTTGVQRRNGGCQDTNNGGSDLQVLAPAPRNGASTPPLVCQCTANETDKVAEIDYCNLQFPLTMTVAAGDPTPLVYARVFENGITPPAGASSQISCEIGYGAAGINPATMAGYTWFAAAFNVQVGNDDEYQASFTAPASGTYSYTSRATRDGTNWTYCDLNGAGSNPALVFESAQLGVLTVP